MMSPQYRLLSSLGSDNPVPFTFLFLSFLYNYSMEFNTRTRVVSVRPMERQDVRGWNAWVGWTEGRMRERRENVREAPPRGLPTYAYMPSRGRGWVTRLKKLHTMGTGAGGWSTLSHLSIEDPFETHYDVAHVLKASTNGLLRLELGVSRRRRR